jgi:hypothetical protein
MRRVGAAPFVLFEGCVFVLTFLDFHLATLFFEGQPFFPAPALSCRTVVVIYLISKITHDRRESPRPRAHS